MKKQIVFGRKPVLEGLESGKTFERVYIDKDLRGEFEIALRAAAKKGGVVLLRVDAAKLKSMTGGTHQGVVGILSPIEYQELEHLVPLLYEQGQIPTIFLLDLITDVRNFGAIARSAEAFGVHALVVPFKGGALINDFAIKASAGALLNIPVCRVKSLQHALTFLQTSGLQVVAADQNDKAIPIGEVDFSQPCAVILGSEDSGVRPHMLRHADTEAFIPQTGKTESLNVSVAAGVIMYEIQKQRRK